jgi:hypothetical protein
LLAVVEVEIDRKRHQIPPEDWVVVVMVVEVPQQDKQILVVVVVVDGIHHL